jgi:CRP-like cAMP-binding protein
MNRKMTTTELVQTYPIVHFLERALLLKPGDTPKAWFIESGIVRQYDILPNGSQITLNIYKPGSVLALAWILHDHENRYYFVAETSVSVRHLPPTVYRDYLQQSNEASYALLERVSSGFEGLFERIVSQGQGDARSRVLTELKIQIARFGTSDHKGPFVSIGVNELAVRTGLARETVSRLLGRLVRQGVISRTGTVIRLN